MSMQYEDQLKDHLEEGDESIRREIEIERQDGFTIVCNHCGETTTVTSEKKIPLDFSAKGFNTVEVFLEESEDYRENPFISNVTFYCTNCLNTVCLNVEEVF